MFGFLKRKSERGIPLEQMPQELERFRLPQQEFPRTRDKEFHEFARDFEPLEKTQPPEKFREFPEFGKPMSFEDFPKKIETAAAEKQDRIELVLQKLENIDLRLKLIEEKLGRRVV